MKRSDKLMQLLAEMLERAPRDLPPHMTLIIRDGAPMLLMADHHNSLPMAFIEDEDGELFNRI